MMKLCIICNLLTIASGALVTSKRTQSSLDGAVDEKFFNRYFGQHDNASTYGKCLNRNLALALPARIGMHYPTSTATVDETGGVKLSDWQARNTAALGNMSTYNGLLDWATVFYVPHLDLHMKQFGVDNVPVLQRTYTTASGKTMYVAIVYTPSSGHVLELQSPSCKTCASKAFARGECSIGHVLPRDVEFYEQAWLNVTQQKGAWSQVGPASLPAPIIVQIKQSTTDLSLAAKLWRKLAPITQKSSGDCEIISAITGVGPFDDHATGQQSLPDYPLQYVFISNKLMGESNVRPYQQFIDQLHSERVGFGWGFDRAMDFHVKLVDTSTFNRDTMPGVSLDHWAALLTDLQIRFGAFNLSQFCPDSGLAGPFGSSNMLYTSGPGNLGIEFWGSFDYTYFSPEKPAYFWGGVGSCSPTFDCRAYLSPADCNSATTSQDAGSHKTIRSRVSANPPSNSAFARLQCEEGSFIDGINFATFGRAEGTCAAGFQTSSNCSVDISSLVKTVCIGHASCNVPASTTQFGTPCKSSNGWWTAIEATCSSDPNKRMNLISI